MVLVDTTVWIDLLKGRETPEVLRLESIIEEEQDVFTTGIILQELLSGIKTKRERTAVETDFRRFILIAPGLETHIQAAEIFDACHKAELTIRSVVDCLNAALALEYDLSLLQKDRDYEHIAQVLPLKLEQV
jgi:predicted nucleic acid-binding protein